MKLAVDIGNTNVVIGLQKDNEWQHIWRLETDKEAEEYNYSIKLNNLLWEAGINPDEIEKMVLSTVVPDLKEIFISLLNKLNGHRVIPVDKKIYPKLNIHIPNPDEIGTDLVANAVAVYNKYKQDFIIIDFGTALTFTVIDANGHILGVNITPGIKTAINSLSDNTSQLDPVPLVLPASPLGHNTQSAIQNGVLIGYTGVISHMIKVLKNEVGDQYRVIATGGLSQILSDHLPQIDIIDRNLTLDGLSIIGDLVS